MKVSIRLISSVGILVALAIAAACGGPDDDATTPAATTVPPITGSPQPADAATYFFAIEEVGLGKNGYVVLRNFTDVPATMGGLYICQPPKCFHLPDVEVAPGEAALVAVREDNAREGVVATWTDLDLTPSDGEVALYASEDAENPEEIRAYLQWGSTPHDGTGTAVDAGLWSETGFAPSSANATRLFHDEGGWWKFDE